MGSTPYQWEHEELSGPHGEDLKESVRLVSEQTRSSVRAAESVVGFYFKHKGLLSCLQSLVGCQLELTLSSSRQHYLKE